MLWWGNLRPDREIQNNKEGNEGTKQSTYLQNLLQKLTSHLQQLPTFGFNSGRYDINFHTW